MIYFVTGGSTEMDQEIWLRHYFEIGSSIHISKSHGYAVFWYQGKLHLLHRWIIDAKPGQEVSHLDGNKLNNKRSNLKICSQSENRRNLNDSLRKDNLSGRRGVRWYGQTQKWQAQISIAGRQTHLGYFDTAEEAHAAYLRVAERLGYTLKI